MSAPLQHCRDEGPAGAPALVFLHALGTDGTLWDGQAAHFAARWRVLRVDAPGHGHSPRWQGTPMDPPRLAAALWATLDHARVGRVALVGTSMGAVTALQAAMLAPERVAALVLCGAHLARGGGNREEMAARADRVRTEGLAGVARQMLARWFPPGMPASAYAAQDAVLAQLLATDPMAYADAAQALQGYDLRPGLQALQARTLLVHGGLDEDVPAHFEALGRQHAGLRVLGLPAIGHFPNLQAPGPFNAAVADFLGGLA